jgi:hypothetical protein
MKKLESGCELIDVTSMSRPDPTWTKIDGAGHLHQWFRDGEPAHGEYFASAKYTVPTLIEVDDESEWEDGEEIERSHLQCTECGETIEPGMCADTFRQFVPGLKWFRINGEPVTEEEYNKAVVEHRKEIDAKARQKQEGE